MSASKTTKTAKTELPLQSTTSAVLGTRTGIAVHSVELVPGSSEVLVAGFGGVWTIDPTTGKEVRRWQGDTGRICWAARITHDGKRVIAGFGDCSLKSWDAQSRELIFTARVEAGIPTRVAISLDGSRAATAAGNNHLQVWDLSSGASIALIGAKKSFAVACALTPDGKLALRGGTDGVVRAHDVASGDEVWASPGHGWIEFMDASGDGRAVAIGGRGKAVTLLDAASGERTRKIDIGANVRVVALSADGRFVAAATSGKRPPCVWDLEGRVVGIMAGHDASVESLRFAHDSASIVSVDDSGRICVFELPPAA